MPNSFATILKVRKLETMKSRLHPPQENPNVERRFQTSIKQQELIRLHEKAQVIELRRALDSLTLALAHKLHPWWAFWAR